MSPLLRPGSSVLERLHPTVARALDPLLPRLAAAVPPLPRDEHPGRGNPDGFDGLTRRGPPERLLASAWALAEEVPDEFLRRAIEGELPYLQQARRHPRGDWRGVLLVDTTSHMAGAPRLPLLAAILVLTERIREAGGLPLLTWWGCAEPGPPETMTSLRRWLAARTRRRITGSDLESLLAPLQLEPERDRLWVLGGPSWGSLAPPSARTVVLQTSLREEGFTVHVGRQALRLPAPDEVAVSQLLTDPEAPARVPSDRAFRDVHLLWSDEGRCLMALHDDEAISLTPGGPDAPLEAEHHSLPARVLGAGLHRGEPAFLVDQGPVIGFAFPRGARGAWNGAPTALPRPPSWTAGPPVPLRWLSDPRAGARPRAAVLVVDGGHTLWLLDALDGRATEVLEEVGAALPCAEGWMLPRRARGRRAPGIVRIGARDASRGSPPTDRRSRAIPALSDHVLTDWIALTEDPVRLLPTARGLAWTDARGELRLAPSEPLASQPASTVGPIPLAEHTGTPLMVLHDPEPALLVLSGARLERVGAWSVETVARLPGPPPAWAVHPDGERLALVDARGEITLMRAATGEILARADLPEGWR